MESVMATEHRIDRGRAKELLKRHVIASMPTAGDYETGLAGVRTYRRDERSKPQRSFYQPMIVKMVQGYKRASLGTED